METHDLRQNETPNNLQEANKALFRRALEEFFVKRDLDSANRNYSANYIQHNENVADGVEGMKNFFKSFLTAFPDFTPTIDHIYAEDDKVFAFITWSGTHKGEFQGIASTGKQIVIKTAEIMRVEDGKFVEHWDVVDQMQMMEALGLITVNKPLEG